MGERRIRRRGGLPRPPGVGERKTPDARPNGARAVPAGLHTLGGGRKAGAPWVAWVLLVTPNNRTQPTSAVRQPRGVEDATPYGWVRDVSISITVSGCANATNLCPPLGSPERGAVAARSGVTEGLVQRGCDAISLPVILRKGRRGRRPLRWVRDERCGIRRDGCGSLTPHQWCAGCARGIGCVGRWTRGWRAVENAGVIGHAGHPQPSRPGNLATTVHRGRCTLRATAKPALRHTSQRVRKTIPHGSAETYSHAQPVGGGVPDAPSV